ncbi:PP2C family protein-serine/threonine phosphatase [Streptomyces sp. NPDC002888]|uniref:PP2C family protein-serine/threonine phosphatase n=1 Tax=Streptomyces sp. NPDC002888 TaxID=3364668 RepID=UPI0036AB2A12
MLRLVAVCGLPVEFTAPWQRLPLTAPAPVADAIRDDRLVRVGTQDEMVRRYPRAAAVLPYRFALAAVPLTGARRRWGGIVLMWPADHPKETKHAWAFLPLIISGRPVGCCILSYGHPHTFTADERAGLIAQALDRARLYDAKHRLVEELQQALLPGTLPVLPGLDVAAQYLPAGHGIEVGGDFYDLLRLDSTTAAAVIGDVEGHSVTAAALMGQVRTAIHAYATAGAPPDQVLARTNRLLADLDSDLLVSCLYAHLDLARHRLVIANAGHVPPLLREADGRARVLDVEPGLLLGVDTRAQYPTTTVTLPPGATLAFYTDGLVEVPDTDATQATSGLVRHLAATDDHDLDGLIGSLVDHNWPTGQYTDDITVLLLRSTPDQGAGARRS